MIEVKTCLLTLITKYHLKNYEKDCENCCVLIRIDLLIDISVHGVVYVYKINEIIRAICKLTKNEGGNFFSSFPGWTFPLCRVVY